MTGPRDRRAMGRIAVASMIGTVVEFYDFFIFSTAAATVFNKLLFRRQWREVALGAGAATVVLAFYGWEPHS